MNAILAFGYYVQDPMKSNLSSISSLQRAPGSETHLMDRVYNGVKETSIPSVEWTINKYVTSKTQRNFAFGRSSHEAFHQGSPSRSCLDVLMHRERYQCFPS